MAYKTKDGTISYGLLCEFVLAYELTSNVNYSDCPNNRALAQEVADNTERVQQLRTELQPIVAQLPQAVSVTIGGSNSKEKGDLLCVSPDGSTYAVNLKRGNNAPERRQGQSWEGVASTYEQLGFDMSAHKQAYLTAAKVFTAGQLRYSDKKADWTPELHKSADIAQQFFAQTESELATQTLDSDALVRGLQNIILGDHSHIFYTDVSAGTVSRITRDMVTIPHITLDTQVSATGRTTRLNIYSDGERIVYFENSVKAQRATRKQAAAGGYQQSADVRSICPQTKICLCEGALDLLCAS